MRPVRVVTVAGVPLYDHVAGLPLRIEDYALERLARTVSSGFERVSSVFALRGAGEEGRGEDVTYETEAHDAQQRLGPVLELAGEWTFDTFSEHLGGLELFPGFTPGHDVYRRYRRWGLESAALDLALRQAGRPLHALLGRGAAADHVRRVLADGRAAGDRPGRAPARALPGAALQARRDAGLERRR